MQINSVILYKPHELREVLIIFLFAFTYSFGINEKPRLVRACINFNDSTISLVWNKPIDVCGSFTKTEIFGNENNGSFQRIATLTDINITEFPHYIPNLNTQRKYYLVIHTACNGIDSFFSDTLSPDLEYPINRQLDSLSYDINTQDIIAGWQHSISSDVKGYQIYDYSTGNGDSIGYTPSTNFIVSSNVAKVFPVVIATLDSCNLSSTLSKPHQVMFLSGMLDTCTKSINLSWSLYKGWQTIDSQKILVRHKNQTFITEKVLNGNTTSLLFNNFILGDTFDIIVRAYTKSGTITSSSNKISFQTRELKTPSLLYLSNISVNNSESIDISVYIQNTQDQKSIVLLKSRGQNPLQIVDQTSLNTSKNYTFNDKDVVVNQYVYNYQVKLTNKCDDTIMISNISNSILLELMPNAKHNSYKNWLGGVEEYNIQYSQDGFTWNTTSSSLDTINTDSLLAGCYRIQAVETTNSLNTNEISYSNKVCKIDSMKIFVPTGINYTTQNNQMIILGTGIDHTKSNYIVYNRWGEQLANLPTDSTWNLQYQGKTIPQGTYIYIVNAIGLLGEKQTIKGTIYVIR